MANDTVVAIRGWVGQDPKLFFNSDDRVEGSAKDAAVFFNVGVTPRLRQRDTGNYTDGQTMWYQVRAWGTLAKNITKSLRKGTPVLVRGKLTVRETLDDAGVSHTNLQIAADAVGIELSTGIAEFTKTVYPIEAANDDSPSTPNNANAASGDLAL